MRTIFLIAAVLLPICATAGSQIEGSSSTITAAPVKLKASTDQLAVEAVLGDGDAAAQLTDYYMYEKNESPKWKYWALIGAENGYARSQFDAYNALIDSTDLLSQRRALYWLKKSSESGYQPATVILKACFPSGDFEGRKLSCFKKE